MFISCQSTWHGVWIIRKRELKEDAKFSDKQKPLSLLLAQKESRKETGSLDFNPYRKGNPHFREGGHAFKYCMKRKTIRLTNRPIFDKGSINNGSPDKAKPTVRGARKAAGLLSKDGRATEG